MKKALLLTLLLTVMLSAQKLTLQESIDKTLSNHPDIRSFILKVKLSQKSYDSYLSAYLPQVNLQANYNPLQTFALPINGAFHTVDDDSFGVGVDVRQKIWDFSRTSSTIKASKVDEEISKLSLEDAKKALIYRVKSLYSLMILQQEAIEVREKDLQTKEAFYNQAKALVTQGIKTKADESRFLASVYVAKDTLALAKALYKKAKTSLSLYINQKIDDDIELEKEVLKKSYSSDIDIEKEILQKNYQLKIDSLSIEKNRLLHKATKASRYGSIDAVASYNHIDTLNSYDSKLIGINLNIPLYSGGEITAQIQKAKISLQLAQELRSSKLLTLKEDIEKLLVDIKRYDKTIKAREAQLDAANETKKVLEARYKEGLATYIEVLDVASVALNAELGVVEAYYLKSMAIDQIEYLKGDVQ